MDNEKQSFLSRLDPRNMKFLSKILTLVLAIIVVTGIVYFTIGLKTLKHTLFDQTNNALEEISYVKAAELKMNIDNTFKELVEFANQDKVKNAGDEFKSGFHLFKDEKYSFFFDDKQFEIKFAVKEYYSKTFAEQCPFSGDQILNQLPDNPQTLSFQFQYIIQNPNPIGLKEQLFNAKDYSSYSNVHADYHHFFLESLQVLGAKDIYLVEPKTGFVIYSVKKNIDFGINLYAEKFKNSALSESYRRAMALKTSQVVISDFERYTPAGDGQVCFAAIPIFSFGEISSIFIVQFDASLYDNMLFDNNIHRGLSTLEYNLIGSDLKLKSNPKAFLIDAEGFVKKYARKVERNEIDRLMNSYATGSMVNYLQYDFSDKAVLQKEVPAQLKDYRGERIVAFSKPVIVDNQKLYLISKISRSEVLKAFRKQTVLYILLTLVLLVIMWFIARFFGKSYSKRQNQLLDALKLLRNGEKSVALTKGANDELGDTIDAYNNLRKRIINAEEFAIEMSEGNYNYDFKILGERDSLGKSLNGLKAELIKSKEEHETRAGEDEIQNWVNQGVAKFNDLLRENTDNINLLAYSLIENLISYINADIGGIYMVEGDDDNKSIDLVSSYAYDRRKYHQKRQEINEGLLGACYLEKKPIFLKEIPEDYIEIVSGLGHNSPKILYIVPLKIDQEVLGMIEIASFQDLEEYKIDFINRVSDSIAATFVSVRLNMKTASLLEESRSRAEEIAQQEEEMRQNMEEMQATQEELARLRQEDEKRTREMQLIIDNTRSTLKNLLDAIPGGYVLKDQGGVIHLINAEGAKYYGLSADRVVGKTDHELLSGKLYESEHKKDLAVIEDGEVEYTEKVNIKGKDVEYKVLKKPFMMDELGQNGILTIRQRKQ